MNRFLTTQEFRFLQNAMRGTALDFFSCGCTRRAIFLDMIEFAAEEEADPDVNVARLSAKVRLMSGVETGVLVDQINRCYFAERMQADERRQTAEAHEDCCGLDDSDDEGSGPSRN